MNSITACRSSIMAAKLLLLPAKKCDRSWLKVPLPLNSAILMPFSKSWRAGPSSSSSPLDGKKRTMGRFVSCAYRVLEVMASYTGFSP